MKNKRLIEKVVREIRKYEREVIAIHDEKWKNKRIRDALIIMGYEKDNQFIKLIDKELSKLNPCATTKISVLNNLKKGLEEKKEDEN